MSRSEVRSFPLMVNGERRFVSAAPNTPLLYVLRNDLSLNGPKYGCGLGECGACSVLVDGKAARSCVFPLSGAVDRDVVTLEGLGSTFDLHPVQRAFIEAQAAQCGYCVNGMIIAVVGLLNRNSSPTETEIRDALANNFCRCGTHIEILEAARQSVVFSNARDVAHARRLGAPSQAPSEPAHDNR